MATITLRNNDIQVISKTTSVVLGKFDGECYKAIPVKWEMKSSDIPPAIWGQLAAYEVR